MGQNTLPLKSVVLFIAVGFLLFIIIFIFAKRQITRFALKSHGPHITIGTDAPKELRQEIERRLHRVGEVRYEPPLLHDDVDSAQHPDAEKMHFYYRMKAIDAIALLDQEFHSYSEHIHRRVGQHTLRSFLLEQRQNGPLDGIKLELVERLTECYDHARHDPAEFLKPQYDEFMDYLSQVIEHVRNYRNKSKKSSVNPSIEELCESPKQSGKALSESNDTGSDVTITKQSSTGDESVKGSRTQGLHLTMIDDEITYRPRPNIERAAGDGSGNLRMRPAKSSGSIGQDGSNLCLPTEGSEVGSHHSSDNFETAV